MGKITEILEAKKGLLAGKGAREEAIRSAERELGLTFSDEYREYLEKYGIAAYSGHELTGITKSPRLNVVDVTRAEKERNPEIPSDFYVVECVNIEEIVMWQSKDGRIFCSSPHMPLRDFCGSFREYISR